MAMNFNELSGLKQWAAVLAGVIPNVIPMAQETSSATTADSTDTGT